MPQRSGVNDVTSREWCGTIREFFQAESFRLVSCCNLHMTDHIISTLEYLYVIYRDVSDLHASPATHEHIYCHFFRSFSAQFISLSSCFSQQCGKPDLKPSHGHFTSEDSPKNQPIHLVYIWRFQSAIEFQSVNQNHSIQHLCPRKMEHCVMRPANTARTLRSAQREAHTHRTRKMSRIERLGWGLGSHRISSENLGTWIYSAVRPTCPQVVIFPVISSGCR